MGPGKEHAELLRVLDARGAKISVREVALDVLEAKRTETWDTDGGERSKARRRIEKANELMKGGYRPGLLTRRFETMHLRVIGLI